MTKKGTKNSSGNNGRNIKPGNSGIDEQDLKFIAQKMKVQKKEDKSEGSKNASVFIAITILAIIFFFALGTKIKINTYVLEKPITGEHKVIERVPYDAIETYLVTEEYKDKIPFGRKDCADRAMNFTVEFNPVSATSKEKQFRCSLTITNLENASGNWSYNAQIMTPVQNFYNSPVRKEVRGNSKGTIEWFFDIRETVGAMNCNYLQESVPSMVKCFYAEPINYQTVTKTRTVERNKTVVKYKEVEKWTNETTYENTTKKMTVLVVFGQEMLHLG